MIAMTQEERDILIAAMEEKIKKTEADIVAYEELSAPVAPDVAIGRISRMDAINNKSVAEAALREAKDKLARLNVAKRRVNAPDFGICSRCKGEIPYKRLLIMPDSTKCVRCSQAEKT